MESNNSSTTQIIIIIVLVIITIALFAYLIIISVQIPPYIVTPFANNSVIKIRSLANNLYLKPINCNEISGCTFSNFSPNVCSNQDDIVIAAIGQYNDSGTNWQLCEYSGNSTTDPITGEAKYRIFQSNNQGTIVMALQGGILTTQTLFGNCIATNSVVLNCDQNQISNYFSFLLNEKVQTGVSSNTTSGSYQIFTSCDFQQRNPLFCSGQGNTDLSLQGCPPFVLSTVIASIYSGCTYPNFDPTCELNYLFEIDVISQ